MYASISVLYLAKTNLLINFRYFLSSHKISNNIVMMIDKIKNKDVVQRINESKDSSWKKINKITKPMGKLIKKK